MKISCYDIRENFQSMRVLYEGKTHLLVEAHGEDEDTFLVLRAVFREAEKLQHDKEQLLTHIKELESSLPSPPIIDWNHLPPWIVAFAEDGDGKQHLFNEEPTIDSEQGHWKFWAFSDQNQMIEIPKEHRIKHQVPWDKSLVMRP